MTVTKESETRPGFCQCGRPLHYSVKSIEQKVYQIVRDSGDPFLTVTIKKNPLDLNERGTSYRVQRHYIALHGVSARTLEEYGFEKVKKEASNVGS